MKRFFILFLLIISQGIIFSEKSTLKFNPWELIIYRPENSENINTVRCFLTIYDENDNDITFSDKVKISYEWVSIPDKANYFKRKVYLQGGMAIHLNLKKGKYKFKVETPKDELYNYEGDAKSIWTSNTFEYNTENPLKVIFVYPTANENGFYNGSWIIDYKAPKFYKVTKPKNQ